MTPADYLYLIILLYNIIKEEQTALMEIISSLTEDLEKIKEDAQNVHSCLSEPTLTTGKHSRLCFFFTHVLVYSGSLVVLICVYL